MMMMTAKRRPSQQQQQQQSSPSSTISHPQSLRIQRRHNHCWLLVSLPHAQCWSDVSRELRQDYWRRRLRVALQNSNATTTSTSGIIIMNVYNQAAVDCENDDWFQHPHLPWKEQDGWAPNDVYHDDKNSNTNSSRQRKPWPWQKRNPRKKKKNHEETLDETEPGEPTATTPLQDAAAAGCTALVERWYKPGLSALHAAAAAGQVDTVRYLQSSHAQSNAVGQSALHVASTWAVAQVLLQAGADPGRVDAAGKTPAETVPSPLVAAGLQAASLLAWDACGVESLWVPPTPAVPGTWFQTLDTVTLERERRCIRVAERLPKVYQSFLVKKQRRAAMNNDTQPQSIPVFHEGHAQILLQRYQWSVKETLLAVYENPPFVLEAAGVPCYCPDEQDEQQDDDEEHFCLVCCETILSEHWCSLQSCEHGFCRDCLRDYVTDCIDSKQGLLQCPHHACHAPLSRTEVGHTTTTAAADQLFLLQAADIKYCPHVGCEGVVKFTPPAAHRAHTAVLSCVGAVCTACTTTSTDDDDDKQHYVPPHRFCFACEETVPHWPAPCADLAVWKTTVETRTGRKTGSFRDVAQQLWLDANTRPCPSCSVSIQKDEGCNHMTCGACRFEFCWICGEDWKLHTDKTGGFYRCNRWVDQKEHVAYDDETPPAPTLNTNDNDDGLDPSAMGITYGTAMHETRVARRKRRETGRFLHYYHRWSAHAESATLEDRLAGSVVERLAPVMAAARKMDNFDNFGGRGLSFIHEAFQELLECRSVLQHSYAAAFVQFDSNSSHIFSWQRSSGNNTRCLQLRLEQVQAELELVTEQLSDAVARSILRASQAQIMFLTTVASEKRKDYSNLWLTYLVRNEEPAPIHTGLSADLGLNESDDSDVDSVVQQQQTPRQGSEEEFALDAAIRESLRDFLAQSGAMDDVLDEEDDEPWSCATCTFVNNNASQGRHTQHQSRQQPQRCTMCGERRGRVRA